MPKKRYLLFSFSYLILCFFYPLAFLFLPLVSSAHARILGKLFDSAMFQPYISYSPLLYIPLFYTMWHKFQPMDRFSYLVIIFLCILSYLLEYHAFTFEHLNQKYIRTFDATRERNLYLKAKNDALITKQDYEISLATMRERNRIARDIHDNVGHLLTRSILITGAIKTLNTNATLSPSIDSLNTTLNEAMTSIRSSVHDLHSQSFHLQDAVESLIHNYTFCNIHFSYKASLHIPDEICYSFLAIIKEALTNTAKHSDATKISLLIEEHPGLYQLIFEDNGTTLSSLYSDGIGLKNMQERITQLQGIFNLRTENGFRIFITIPKKGNNK
jgi:signal transduction histidine kinase